MYKEREDRFYHNSFSTSGVVLRFITDSSKLFLDIKTEPGTKRTFFSVDLFVNGQYADCLKNFDPAKLPENYSVEPFELGCYEKSFSLGLGCKEIAIYLPWSIKTVIREIALDDGAVVEPVKPAKTLLAFGDSITQGYDATHPSNKYITQLSNLLGAIEHNKAIGGEVFWPDLASTKEDYVPDYITVAYGTNDWSKRDRQTLERNCFAFFKNLAENYPDSQIYALTPIWRKLMYMEKPAGPFTDVPKIIREATAPYKNITVIEGMEHVPHDSAYFADTTLHPNDQGFIHYFTSLKKYF